VLVWLLVATAVPAQRPTIAEHLVAERAMVNRWRADGGADTARTTESIRLGGASLFRAVLAVSRDTARPTATRLGALQVVLAYLAPGSSPGCRSALADTIRDARDVACGIVSHPDYTGSTSIEPTLRDTARV